MHASMVDAKMMTSNARDGGYEECGCRPQIRSPQQESHARIAPVAELDCWQL